MFLPILNLAFGHITLVVVFGVPFAAISFRFDQNCAASLAGIIDGLLRHFITGDHVVPVDNVTGNAEGRRALCQITHRRLHVRGRRVRVMIVLGDYYQRQMLYGRKIHPLVKCAGAGAAIANISEADNLFLLQARAQKDARHHRNHVTQMRNWPEETFVEITEVHVQIFATGRTPGFGHVLSEDFARANPFHKTGAEIANDWRDEIIRSQRISRANGRCFLA